MSHVWAWGVCVPLLCGGRGGHEGARITSDSTSAPSPWGKMFPEEDRPQAWPGPKLAPGHSLQLKASLITCWPCMRGHAVSTHALALGE